MPTPFPPENPNQVQIFDTRWQQRHPTLSRRPRPRPTRATDTPTALIYRHLATELWTVFANAILRPRHRLRGSQRHLAPASTTRVPTPSSGGSVHYGDQRHLAAAAAAAAGGATRISMAIWRCRWQRRLLPSLRRMAVKWIVNAISAIRRNAPIQVEWHSIAFLLLLHSSWWVNRCLRQVLRPKVNLDFHGFNDSMIQWFNDSMIHVFTANYNCVIQPHVWIMGNGLIIESCLIIIIISHEMGWAMAVEPRGPWPVHLATLRSLRPAEIQSAWKP